MKEQVCSIVRNLLTLDESVLLNDDQSLEELGLDSMLFIEIVVELETVFNVEIPDDYLVIASLNTVNKLVEALMVATPIVQEPNDNEGDVKEVEA